AEAVSAHPASAHGPAVAAPVSAVAVRQRRSVTQLLPAQLETLRQGFAAVLQLRDDRGYQFHAGIHGLPLPKYCKVAHGQPLFLAWHRAYLYTFELALRDQVADVSLAWWDWRHERKIPAAFADNTDDSGGANSLQSM